MRQINNEIEEALRSLKGQCEQGSYLCHECGVENLQHRLNRDKSMLGGLFWTTEEEGTYWETGTLNISYMARKDVSVRAIGELIAQELRNAGLNVEIGRSNIITIKNDFIKRVLGSE